MHSCWWEGSRSWENWFLLTNSEKKKTLKTKKKFGRMRGQNALVKGGTIGWVVSICIPTGSRRDTTFLVPLSLNLNCCIHQMPKVNPTTFLVNLDHDGIKSVKLPSHHRCLYTLVSFFNYFRWERDIKFNFKGGLVRPRLWFLVLWVDVYCSSRGM